MGYVGSAAGLVERFLTVRGHTEQLASGLTDEDQCLQSMPDASPAKWHRAHTTWFFEQFVLVPNLAGYEVFDPTFSFLFNSYYDAVGARHPRPIRGLITRPGAQAVGEYRRHVDAALLRLLADPSPELSELVELGLHHEQQHGELLMADVLHGFAQNPLLPAMLPNWREPVGRPGPTRFVSLVGGITPVGHAGGGFAFDNEGPQHEALLRPFLLADRLVRNVDWLAFMEDGGYRRPGLWMSDGWACAGAEGWSAPMHWHRDKAGWRQFGPGGLAPLEADAPVRHVSWYEADAYARWAVARLPTEFELEYAAQSGLGEFTTHVWQWTGSAYLPYPGFKPVEGAIGEYNGKFMINQMVLRGGSMATPPGHLRPTYRNFFPPDKRWQFSGLRLARDPE